MGSSFLIAVNVLKPNGVVVGLAFELTFLSLLLTVRYNNLKKEKEQLRNEQQYLVANSVIHAQETERKRLAQDLHDDLGDTLSGLKLLITNYFIQKSTTGGNHVFQPQAVQLLDKAVEDVRSIAQDLMPRDFSELGIPKSLEYVIKMANASQCILFSYVFSAREDDISKEMQLSLFRIINELIQNVIRHSNAKLAMPQLLIYENILHILMEDDGIGMKSNETKTGIGRSNISSRVEYFRGNLNVDSGKHGTTIIIEIPLAT